MSLAHSTPPKSFFFVVASFGGPLLYHHRSCIFLVVYYCILFGINTQSTSRATTPTFFNIMDKLSEFSFLEPVSVAEI